MLDNYGLSVERIMRMKTVNKTSKTYKVNDDFNSDSNSRGSFQENFNRAPKKEIVNEENNKKELIDEAVIVDSSLNRRLKEQKIISELVQQKFVNNPSLLDKIKFDDGLTLEERILSLVNDEMEDIEVKRSASEELIEQLQKAIDNINKNA